MAKPLYPSCAQCPNKSCNQKGSPDLSIDISKMPAFCPMKIEKDVLSDALKEYQNKYIKEFARLASLQEAECYENIGNGIRTKIPRVEETIQFAQKMGYQKLGLIFCLGLENEAALFNKILESNDFVVVSICCKTGGVDKVKIGIKPEQKIHGKDSFEPMCNPIAQAMVMNKEKPDWVIIMGLCVGHDTLVMQYCKRPMTVLAVKDRVLAHNPLGALYLANSVYYNRLLPKK